MYPILSVPSVPCNLNGHVDELSASSDFTQFWVDPTGEEDLIMDFAARPGKGLDEAWIDSFYGVLDSCYRTKQAPHFLQLMAFYDASISLPGNIPKPLGTLIVYIFGHVIAPLAGFTGTYPMYVAETREKS